MSSDEATSSDSSLKQSLKNVKRRGKSISSDDETFLKKKIGKQEISSDSEEVSESSDVNKKEQKNPRKYKLQLNSTKTTRKKEHSIPKLDDDLAEVISRSECTCKEEDDVGETSDTSIEDRYEKRPGKCSSSIKKSESSKRQKPFATKDTDIYSARLIRLKKMVIAAGLRFNYKKMFDDLTTEKQMVKKLEDELRGKGVTTLTLEACRVFKLKKEEENELAELSRNTIIDIGSGERVRVTRAKRAAVTTSNKVHVAQCFSSEESNDDNKKKTSNFFANLQGIVSDEGETD